MTIKYLHDFVQEFEALNKMVRKQLFKKLSEMSRQDLHAYPHKPLKGSRFKGLYKLRSGDWRLIYKLFEHEVLLITLGHRRDVYE